VALLDLAPTSKSLQQGSFITNHSFGIKQEELYPRPVPGGAAGRVQG